MTSEEYEKIYDRCGLSENGKKAARRQQGMASRFPSQTEVKE